MGFLGGVEMGRPQGVMGFGLLRKWFDPSDSMEINHGDAGERASNSHDRSPAIPASIATDPGWVCNSKKGTRAWEWR